MSWKLTASYTFVTVAVLVMLEFVLFFGFLLANVNSFSAGRADFLTIVSVGATAICSVFLGTLLFAIAAGVIGTIFGFFTARGLTSRLRRVTTTAEAWGEGDFSRTIDDHSADEIGQMARRLNAMAIQLQELIRDRQELSAIDERNRLARNLHDSVKQQMFAINMNLAAIQDLWHRDPDSVRARLDIVMEMAQSSQQELTAIIHMLRPVQLEGKGLWRALTEYIRNWREQTNVEAVMETTGNGTLPLYVEEPLFRVAQEALSNVARHSGASSVWIELVVDEEITLEIRDNGRGFAPNRIARGVGLHSMRERVEAVGGCLKIASAPGSTEVVARIPLRGVAL